MSTHSFKPFGDFRRYIGFGLGLVAGNVHTQGFASGAALNCAKNAAHKPEGDQHANGGWYGPEHLVQHSAGKIFFILFHYYLLLIFFIYERNRIT